MVEEYNELDPRIQSDLGKAAEARMLLEHPMIRGALEQIRATIITKFKSTSLKDQEAREQYHKFLILTDTFEGILRSYVETGIMAELDMQQDSSFRSWKERLKEYWKF